MTADNEQLQTELAARGLELGDAVRVSHVIEATSDSVWQAITGGAEMITLGKREINSRAYTGAFNFKDTR